MTNSEALFWAKVDKSGECWLWMGSDNGHGYGRLTRARRSWLAHRFAWQLTHEPVPQGMDLCHHCDVRRCVRPTHLYVGTRRDNMRDAISRHRLDGRRRGRQVRGETHGSHKLTAAQVTAIRAIYRPYDGITQAALAEQYNCSQATIWRIVNYTHWIDPRAITALSTKREPAPRR